eukprot:271879-Prymnesium_polylepis.1
MAAVDVPQRHRVLLPLVKVLHHLVAHPLDLRLRKLERVVRGALQEDDRHRVQPLVGAPRLFKQGEQLDRAPRRIRR